jgi:predicted ATPase
MLTDFEVAKYRPFDEWNLVELRPLTLVYGRNAAGKSALVRALPLIAGALQGRGPEPLDLSLPALRGSTYRELTSYFSASGELQFGCGWRNRSTERESLRVTLKGLSPQFERQVIDKWVLRGGSKAEYTYDWGDQRYDVQREGMDNEKQSVEFLGVVPKAFLERLSDLRSLRVEWLGPDRPAPLAVAESISATGISPDGAGCRRLLAESRRLNSNLLSRVSESLKRVVGQQLDVLLHPQIDAFTIRVGASPSQDRMVRLSNTGEGVSHVLPVLVALEVGEKESAPDHIVIEQPEIHLHPHAECELGKIVAEAAQRSGGPRYLIETHSENLLLGVQLAIVQKRLAPENVIVYFVHQDEEGHSRAARVELDERAEPNGPIPQPFGEGLALARSLVEARRDF